MFHIQCQPCNFTRKINKNILILLPHRLLLKIFLQMNNVKDLHIYSSQIIYCIIFHKCTRGNCGLLGSVFEISRDLTTEHTTKPLPCILCWQMSNPVILLSLFVGCQPRNRSWLLFVIFASQAPRILPGPFKRVWW